MTTPDDSYADRIAGFQRNIANSVEIYRKFAATAGQNASHHRFHADVARENGDEIVASLYEEIAFALEDAQDAYEDAMKESQKVFAHYEIKLNS